MKSASIDAFYAHRDSGSLGNQERTVLDFLARHPARDWTRSELAAASGIRLSSVCGRANTLVALERVVEGPRRACGVTGRSAHPLRLAPVQREIEAFA